MASRFRPFHAAGRDAAASRQSDRTFYRLDGRRIDATAAVLVRAQYIAIMGPEPAYTSQTPAPVGEQSVRVISGAGSGAGSGKEK